MKPVGYLLLVVLLLSGCGGARTIAHEEVDLTAGPYEIPDRLREKPARGWTVVVLTVVNCAADRPLTFDLDIVGDEASLALWKGALIENGVDGQQAYAELPAAEREEKIRQSTRTVVARVPAGGYAIRLKSTSTSAEFRVTFSHPTAAFMVLVTHDEALIAEVVSTGQ